MAIFTTLITATKLLVKNMAKKKLKEKAKSFVTGDKDKKKVGKEVKREKITKIMGDQGAKSYGADDVKPVETQTQTISPSKFMGADMGDRPKIEPKSSGRVDFNSLNKRLDNIVGMTDMIVVATKATAQQKKDELNILAENRKKQEAKARQAKLKAKKPGLIGKAAQGIKKKAQNPLDAMIKFLANIAFGALILFLVKNAKKIKKMFQLIGDNIETFGKILRVGIFGFQEGMKLARKGFSLLATGAKKLLSPIGKAFTAIRGAITGALSKLAGKFMAILQKIPGVKTITNMISGTKKGIDATKTALTAKREAIKEVAKKKFNKVTGGILKKGLKKAPSRLAIKLFGKTKAKKIVKIAKGVKGITKGVRIPILGPIIVAVTSMLAGDPAKQTLFKAIGAGFGGAIGSLGGPLGMLVGEIVGEFIGNFLFELFNGDPSGTKGKALIKKRFDQIVSGVGKYGKMFLDFVMSTLGKLGNFFKEGFGRFVKNFPTLNIPEGGGVQTTLGKVANLLGLSKESKYMKDGRLVKVPNLALLTPMGMPLLLPHLKNSFFPSKDGEEKPKDAKVSKEKTDETTDAVIATSDNSEKIGESNNVSDGGGTTAKLDEKDTSSVASTTSAVSTQASYEESSAGTVILGEPSRSNFPSGAAGDAQFQRAVLLAADQKSMLNSYYKTQVKASLYKV